MRRKRSTLRYLWLVFSPLFLSRRHLPCPSTSPTEYTNEHTNVWWSSTVAHCVLRVTVQPPARFIEVGRGRQNTECDSVFAHLISCFTRSLHQYDRLRAEPVISHFHGIENGIIQWKCVIIFLRSMVRRYARGRWDGKFSPLQRLLYEDMESKGIERRTELVPWGSTQSLFYVTPIRFLYWHTFTFHMLVKHSISH